MNKDQVVQAVVADLTHEGLAVVKHDQRVYFVPGALPGESITFRPGRKRKGNFDGELIEVLSASDDRVEPECEFYAVCGGCSLQHVDAQKQIEYKEKILFDNLERIGRVQSQERLARMQADLWHYRRKARPGIKYVPKKGGALVGFREKQSSFITPMTHCHTLHGSLSDLISPLRELVDKMSQPNKLPQVEVAVGDDNKVMLILRHLYELSDQDKVMLIDFAKAHDVIMMTQAKGPKSVTPLWPEKYTLLSYRLAQYDVSFEFRADDFVQVNSAINEKMIAKAIELLHLQKDDHVLDLFCGLGNFSLPMARHCQSVMGIEGDQALVDKAVGNAKNNGMDNVQFKVQDLYQIEDKASFADWQLDKINKVLLDPPRSGARDIVEQLFTHIRPEIIVYVSCNPATLARDAGILVNEQGYQLAKAGVIDMFPHTAHVESIALFIRQDS